MMSKVIILFLLLLNISYASYQEVRIGKIDSEYKDRVTKEQLRNILKEIENTLESQLNMNIFDYSNKGKEINLTYLPPSRLEKQIERKVKRLKDKEKKINDLNKYFPSKQEEIDTLKHEVEYENTLVNQKVKVYNDYVKNINQNKNLTTSEFNKIKEELKQKKKILNTDIRIFKKKQSQYKRLINQYNQKINSYNYHINVFNQLSNEIEVMSRSFKKVKGMTFGIKEVKLKTVYKNGQQIRQKEENQTMNKIEIYGFSSLNELKAILAHEIGHLVGISHIYTNGALMNPILQKNQIENLFLTKEDIKAFKKFF